MLESCNWATRNRPSMSFSEIVGLQTLVDIGVFEVLSGLTAKGHLTGANHRPDAILARVSDV